MDLVYFKILSGEEVISKGKKVNGGWYVEDPATLVHLKDYKIGLANWLPYTKISEGTTIPDSAIVFAVDVADDMAIYYTKWANPDIETNESPTTESSETLI
jgi:hypothetical protein